MATEESKAPESAQPLFSLRTLLIASLLAVFVCLFALWWSGYGLDKGKGLVATLITVVAFLIFGELVRQRCRYSLRQLLTLVTVIAICLGFFSQSLWQARKQQQVVEIIVRLGGSVAYEYRNNDEDWFQTRAGGPTLPSWLLRFLGEDVFAHVGYVDLRGSSVRDADLERFGDALPELGGVALHNSQITDAGLEHLARLDNLWTVDLNGQQATRKGLAYLGDLPSLGRVRLYGRSVTNATLANFDELPNLQRLTVSNANVTNTGLVNLKSLPNLRQLSLIRTGVTDDGAEKLREALPNCEIYVRP